MRKLLIVAALLMLTAPARADTFVIELEINPSNAPDGMKWADLYELYRGDQFDIISGPAIMPTFADPNPYSYILIGEYVIPTATVPEPATWLMMLLGFLGLTRLIRRPA